MADSERQKASSTRSSRKNRRLMRTALLALCTSIAICYALYDFWDVSLDQLFAIILAAVMIVGATALAAFGCVLVLQIVRKK